MSAGNLFSLRDQGPSAEEPARLHAAAEKALAEAEYEFYAMQVELQAALLVPLATPVPIESGNDARGASWRRGQPPPILPISQDNLTDRARRRAHQRRAAAASVLSASYMVSIGGSRRITSSYSP